MQEPTDEPISSPQDKQCFNCGKDLETKANFCTHCGAPLPTQGSGILLVLRFFGVFGLGCMALLFGMAGACFLSVARDVPGKLFKPSAILPLGLTGSALVGLAALCIWGTVILRKHRKNN